MFAQYERQFVVRSVNLHPSHSKKHQRQDSICSIYGGHHLHHLHHPHLAKRPTWSRTRDQTTAAKLQGGAGGSKAHALVVDTRLTPDTKHAAICPPPSALQSYYLTLHLHPQFRLTTTLTKQPPSPTSSFPPLQNLCSPSSSLSTSILTEPSHTRSHHLEHLSPTLHAHHSSSISG